MAMMSGADLPSFTVASAQAATVAEADRAAILDIARQPVAQHLGKPVKFKVRTLHRDGDWAFLIAEMQDSGGRPISYAGTPLASAEAEGMVSKDYAALLRRIGGHWRVADYAIGPTDVAWAEWPAKHKAPRALFP
ncbi:hypothetical protein LZK98_06020 [Sphingomonas cannabina]|uniref:hypothetical protein n=1 Tax=Sphingomonas cannabina TaxID=2899123 RepID=UPI001F1FE673|nr:hypothetical protein [Sphingomonas cannabina]UIJ46503.1 hypothetical protein LZK98_06020 [Sphingomonas cannabina]